MLHRKLWLAGAVGAICLAISAGIAQDQAPARSEGAAPERSPSPEEAESP